eukprot:NODE_194_length_15414_cov_0.324127.p3 type:complete len:440 gc:universal NODE_194_length_15414_cov_0.324127:9026-7707(-)
MQSFTHFSKTLSRPRPTKPAELVIKPKAMRESFIQQLIFLKSDPFTRELYSTSDKQLRISKLLENLDALAAAISYRHLDDGRIMQSPEMLISIVTASVDRIDLISMPTFMLDMIIYGHVSYVGSSSMEISLTINHIVYKDDYKLPDLSVFDSSSIPIYTAASPESSDIVTRVYIDSGNPDVDDLNRNVKKRIPVLTAKFCMVARCAYLQKSVQVHPLAIRNEKEQQIFNQGAQLRTVKKLQNQQSLINMPPTNLELATIHDLFIGELDGSLLHENAKRIDLSRCYMRSTTLETTSLMQPSDRNVHNFIFGGYLLRTAYDLAICTSMIYTKSKSIDFIAMDDVLFRLPVPVGSILRLKSMVVYSTPPSDRQNVPKKWKDAFQVIVIADVMSDSKFETSNVFHFTFKPTEETRIKFIVPETYQESMLYLQGKRIFEHGMRQ